jgi:hypothetical protein
LQKSESRGRIERGRSKDVGEFVRTIIWSCSKCRENYHLKRFKEKAGFAGMIRAEN